MRFTNGATAAYIHFVALSTSDHITRVTGLTSFNVYAAATSASTGSTYGISVQEVNSTQMPGLYRLQLADSTLMTVGSGFDNREIAIHITSSMDPVTRVFEVYRRDVTSGQTLALNSSGKIADVESVLTKVTSVDSRLTSMDTMLSSVNAKVTSVDSRLSSMDTMLSSVNAKVSSIDTDIDTVITKVTSIDSRLTSMDTMLTSVNAKVTSVDSRLTSMDTMLSSVNAKVSSIDTDIDTALARLTSINAETTALIVLATSINTRVNAVQAQTTQLAFTQSGKVDANIHYVNNVQVQGVGTTTDTWRPV